MVVRSINSIVHRANRLGINFRLLNKKVYCFELQKMFLTVHEAAEATGASYRSIMNCCLKKQITANDMHFCFLEDKDNYELLVRGGKQVICVNTQKIYPSILTAAEETGCNKTQISLCCNGHLKTTHGLTWMFYSDFLENPIAPNSKRQAEIHQYEINTGIFLNTYASGADAAAAVGLSRTKSSFITSSARGRRPTAYGYYWSRIKADNYFDIKEEN